MEAPTTDLLRVIPSPCPTLIVKNSLSPPSAPPPLSALTNLVGHLFYANIINLTQLPRDAGTLLANTLQSDTLVISCDGSYKPHLGVASYGVALASQGTPNFGFSGPCPGHASQLTAIHAELCSIMVTLHLLNEICILSHTSTGSVKIYNDCAKTLKLVNHPGRKFKRFLTDNFDLIYEVRTLLSSTAAHLSQHSVGERSLQWSQARDPAYPE